MAKPTNGEARTQLVLTVIAIAVGGIVFALTSDVVIGVGIGAASFALARQGVRVWGQRDDDRVSPGAMRR